MTGEELEKWRTSNNCTGSECYHANGISYLFETMRDGWTAVFEIDRGQYIPRIQAADRAHAVSYCIMTEPLTVPVQII